MSAALKTGWKHNLQKLSIEHVWCFTVLAGICAFVSTHPIRPHDFWWHIRVGQEMVASGHIPTVDVFSFTVPGKLYSSYAMFWLMETSLYWLHSLGGPALVIFAHTLVIVAAYGLLLRLCWKIAGSGRVAAICALFAAALGLNDWNVRPQTISFLLATLMLWAIYTYRSGPRRWLVVVFPVCELIWVNSHPTFPLGLVLVGAWLCDEGWQELKLRLAGQRRAELKHLLAPGIALATAAMACLVNPQGLGIVAYLSSMGKNPVIQNLVLEWAPPSFNSLTGSLFLLSLLASAVLLAASPRRPSLMQLVTLVLFAGLGLKTLRGIVWFGIVMAPILADHLPQLALQVRQMGWAANNARSVQANQAAPRPIQLTLNYILNYLLVGLMTIGLCFCLPWFKHRLPLPPSKAGLISAETPVEATQFLLKEKLPGPIFHNQAFGSYLIWAAWPAFSVFVDPRIELYPAQVWLDYLEISSGGCHWQERLDQYGIQTLMLSPTEQTALIQAARESAEWQQVYQDSRAIILTRRGPP